MITLFFVLCLVYLLHSRIYYTYGDGILPVKGSKFWTTVVTYGHRVSNCHSTCHTFCDKGHPFIMVISEDPRHSHLLLSSGGFTTCFNDLALLRQGFEHLTFRMWGKRSTQLCHCCDIWLLYIDKSFAIRLFQYLLWRIYNTFL